MGSLSLLQGIFPTQELNRGLLHHRWILYQLSYVPLLSLLYTWQNGGSEKLSNLSKVTELAGIQNQAEQARLTPLPWESHPCPSLGAPFLLGGLWHLSLPGH